MTIRIETVRKFDNDLKRLRRKYPRINNELNDLVDQLKAGHQPGDKIPNVERDVYKVRLRNPSAKKGKSGGFRVIYYVRVADYLILLTIYSKSEQTDITPEQIRRIIDEEVPNDIELDADKGDTDI